ncbi:MAG: zinc-ribbon domain-containing protein [Nitrospirae bacterium]|nr:zinc-ribbon domain-containing protein [Nitrospirota bacterium]
MIVRCSSCGVKLKIDESKIPGAGAKVRCPKCQTIFPVTPAGARPEVKEAPPPPPVREEPAAAVRRPEPPVVERPVAAPEPVRRLTDLPNRNVVVAIEEAETAVKVQGVLSGAGFSPVAARDGLDAIVRIERERPVAAVLGVSLGKVLGVDICEYFKADPETKSIVHVLVPSAYDSTRYTRPATDLYSADAMVRNDEIEKRLVEKLIGALGLGAPRERVEEPAGGPPVPVERPPVAPPAFEIPAPPPPPPAPEIPAAQAEGVGRARRFARTILSDIALYNPKVVEEGIRIGSLREALKGEIQEGKDLYALRIPEEVRRLGDFYEEAITEFIEKRRRAAGQ